MRADQGPPHKKGRTPSGQGAAGGLPRTAEGAAQVSVFLPQSAQVRLRCVVGVERDPPALGVRLARSLGIPVLAGHGGDRAVLEKLHLHRARALAAVGSDGLDNIAVAGRRPARPHRSRSARLRRRPPGAGGRLARRDVATDHGLGAVVDDRRGHPSNVRVLMSSHRPR
ncbi:NAD-binding protein [Streptomyces sp. CA-288835]|uniref:NAD-binding protein n=1 Tax=Streptomyces sp. CA-288835 TaxID=3240069 RepID=UPI003D8F0116